MIIEFYDAIDRMLWAILAWIVIAAAVAAPVVVVAAWAVTRAVKRAWRALSGPYGASDAPEVAPDPHDAPEAPEARSSDSSYQEAA